MTTTTSTAQQVQPARRIAYEVLAAVREDDAYANLLLPVRLQRAKLNTADAALATELTYGTLRKLGYYDTIIGLASGRSTAKIDPPLLDVLRIATHQLLSMRVAPHAAVNEAVLQARAVGSRSGTGFVNGVLRTIGRTDREEWQHRVLEGAGTEDERLSVFHSHPEWVVRAFRHALKAEGAESELGYLLQADNSPPKISLTALPGLADRAEHGWHATESEFSPIGVILSGGDPLSVPGVKEGVLRVQDEGSQLAALALTRARPVIAGEKWLDLCAGPGGKAALMAAEAAVGGATLISNEIVPVRAELVRRALAPVPGAGEVLELDGTLLGNQQPDTYDRILLDAPCSGLGALRRRPEARWRKQPKDIAALTPLQGALFDSAVRALKPGGLLAYVTCSPHLAETRLVTAAAIKRWKGAVEAVDTPEVLERVTDGALKASGNGQAVQLWPHRYGTDAMYIALFQKKA